MTRATTRRRVLKALAAVGCRGSRNDHDITHVDLFTWENRERFCRAIAGNQRSPLHEKLFTHCRAGHLYSCGCPYDLRNLESGPVQTIGDLVEAVRAAYPL